MGLSQLRSGVTPIDGSVVLGWLVLSLAVSGNGCVQNPPSPQPSPPSVNTHQAPDGTLFLTAQQSLAALPSTFPHDLLYPDASVVSSGKIEDPRGGVLSALIRTEASQEQVLEYYQQTLWFSGWELLTRWDQEDVVILTFEENVAAASPPTPYRQAVIQLGPTTKGRERDILVLLSWVEGSESFTDPSLEMLTFSQWLLGANHQAFVQHLSTLLSSRTSSPSDS